MPVQPLFILTSAINTKLCGAHSNEERWLQTLATISSIRRAVANAKILVVEMAGLPLQKSQIDMLQVKADYLVDFSGTQQVLSVCDNTTDLHIVKNVTEVMVFGDALFFLLANKFTEQFDRIFKISGRYELTEKFDPDFYDLVPDRIVVAQRKISQFSPEMTGGIGSQYMSRLWSWPSVLTPVIANAYKEGLAAMVSRYAKKGYFDIEHMLFKWLPADLVTEVEHVGVRGLLGPNKALVED